MAFLHLNLFLCLINIMKTRRLVVKSIRGGMKWKIPAAMAFSAWAGMMAHNRVADMVPSPRIYQNKLKEIGVHVAQPAGPGVTLTLVEALRESNSCVFKIENTETLIHELDKQKRIYTKKGNQLIFEDLHNHVYAIITLGSHMFTITLVGPPISDSEFLLGICSFVAFSMVIIAMIEPSDEEESIQRQHMALMEAVEPALMQAVEPARAARHVVLPGGRRSRRVSGRRRSSK